VRLLQFMQDGFVRVSGRDADRHAVLSEQPRTTGADTRATTNDQCNLLFGALSVALTGFCHVSCSHSALRERLRLAQEQPVPSRRAPGNPRHRAPGARVLSLMAVAGSRAASGRADDAAHVAAKGW
jgi:hypothetical protein